MKTLKWLKISAVLQAFFVFSCISSTLCFAVNQYFDVDLFFSLGNILLYGWIINPTGLIILIVGLILFFSEKSIQDNLQKIGTKWIWFILSFVFDLLLYLTAGMLTVAFTGGV